MTHSFEGIVRTVRNDLCIRIKTPTGLVHLEAEDLREAMQRHHTSLEFVAAAKTGADAIRLLRIEQAAKRLRGSSIPYTFQRHAWVPPALSSRTQSL